MQHAESDTLASQDAAAPRGHWRWPLALLTTATFLIFFQAFMVAPLLPKLATEMGTTPETIGVIVPLYLIPYGAMVLVWGPLSDRLGRGGVILMSWTLFVGLTAITAAATSFETLLAARIATALGASGVVPIGLAFVGDVVEFRRRGRALGWLFGAMAAGVAFGASGGALLESLIGWRGLFLGVASLAAIILMLLIPAKRRLTGTRASTRPRVSQIVRGYLGLLAMPRARRTYAFVLANGILHHGVFTWLGLYLAQRHGLGELGIGLALLGYGIPGFLFGPLIGRLADRIGRARLIPAGVAVTAISVFAFAAEPPLWAIPLVAAALSLGYDLTQPLLGGIVTTLSPNRGQAMGLNVFTLFLGFGLGGFVFQILLPAGFTVAFALFASAALATALVALPAFKAETAAQ